MTSKEIVIKAVEFKSPERLPLEFGSLGHSDIHWAAWNQIGTGDHAKKKTYDEWGCGWERTNVANMGQVTEHPLPDWSSLRTYRWPDPDQPSFFEGMERKFEGSEGKYVKTGLFMLLFERMHSLRGFENTLTDLYLERENIERLADKILEFDIRIIANISARFPGAINALDFTDDWGTELALFINPSLWREFFKPRYKKIFDACKEAGWHIWMHSCGKVNEIIGDLIEIGVDAINLQQPTVLGIKEIGRRFAGKVCFSSLCDIQKTLPYKGENEIREEAELLMKNWSTKDGGFILSDYGDGNAIGVPLEKKQWMFNAFTKLDPWRNKSWR
ncbi:MAG: uroporphyrinogen decarboxylase family protein [Bacillota bacterium]